MADTGKTDEVSPDAPDEKTFKYDVAFSFLSNDLQLAQAMAKGLSPSVPVFLYANRQEEIAGTDGIEAFRTPFLTESRLVVVLFRSAWGNTKGTRIEMEAIKERIWQQGYEFLLVVMVDNSPRPPWLPPNKIRFNLEEFGLEQAVGAIKLRVQELGAKFRRETVVERAARSAKIREFNQETERLFRTSDGVDQATEAAVELVDLVEKIAMETSTAVPDLNIKVGKGQIYVSVATRGASLTVGWHCNSINDLGDSYLGVLFYKTKIIVPGDQLRYIGKPPQPVNEIKFEAHRLRGIGWCWKSSEDGSIKNSSELAQHSIALLLELIEQG